MADAIAHRGPDDSGIWIGGQGLCLAHRRLAVIDLSPGGRQPMMSRDGRHVIVFNGEIYNFAALRREVEEYAGGISWRGHSDTEVLLEAIAAWGVPGTLPKLNGMFAFALWDEQERALYLARDRFGEKPLYYGYAGNTLLFGSELKALYRHPAWEGVIDADAIADFLRLSYIPAPRSIFRDMRKLMPANWIRFETGDIAALRWPAGRQYWSARATALAATTQTASGSEQYLIDETERRLRDAVGLRMAADVPLGAFLSGGIDSSLVVAMMQKQAPRPVKTFSIGVHDSRYNEASDAAAVARHLGTEHTELYVSERDALDVIPRLPMMYDEPFADASQIPTFLVSQMARSHVTVALSGDGGDEFFGGYNRHAWVPRLWGLASVVPQSARAKAAALLLRHSPRELDDNFARAARFLPAGLRVRTPGDKLHKLAGVLAVSKPAEIYAELLAPHSRSDRLLKLPALGTGSDTLFPAEPELALTQWMMLCDTLNYLPDDILTKVDRAGMAVSLETRIPYLDPDLYEWAWRLPASMKVRSGTGKWVLRQVLYRHVPREIVDRPKAGFGIPLDALLRDGLKEWAYALLTPARLHAHGLLHPDAVHTLLEEHMSGRSSHTVALWNVLMLNAWLEQYHQHITALSAEPVRMRA